jgi:hypothetical protein
MIWGYLWVFIMIRGWGKSTREDLGLSENPKDETSNKWGSNGLLMGLYIYM